MQSITFPIRWKLLTGFVGLALLVLLVVLFTVSWILDTRIRENIYTNFQEAGKIFEQLQDIRFRQLHQTTTLVADMPYIKEAVSAGDADAINSQVRQELLQLLRFDPLSSGMSSSELLTASVDSVGFVMVFNRNGIPLSQAAGTDLPNYSMTDKAGVRTALEGHSPRQPYIWKRKGRYFSVITVPVFLQDRVIAALSIGYPIRNVEAELLAQLIEYEVSYFVDSQLLATSIDLLSNAGRKDLTEHIQNALLANPDMEEGTTAEVEFEDQRWLIYILPIVQPNRSKTYTAGYYTILAQSLTKALAPLHELQWVIYLIGFGGILIAIMLGITLTHNLTRPIHLLLDGIKRIENEEYDQPVAVVSRDEFGQLTRTFNTLVSNIQENLREKETLLAEIHHRVKNNLAIISGLLQLEGSSAENPHAKRILKNSHLRIHSMATVHELLYQAQNFSRLSFGSFVSKIVHSIQEVYAMDRTHIELNLDVSDVQLNVNQAVPCGLIVNELITNAFKHAYPADKTGIINVSLQEQGNKIFLRVGDEGVGLPKDFAIEESESLGFTLVNILAKQLEADITIESQNGTNITIVFEKEEKKGASSSLNLNQK